MKKILLVSFCFTASFECFSQLNTENLRGELATASTYSSGANGYEGLQSFASKDVTGSQFYFPVWASGSLITTNNETAMADYVYLYDKVRQTVFMKDKSSTDVSEVSKDKIRGFTLTNNGTHTFALASEWDATNKTDFYEVLVRNDKGYTLLKSVKTKFVKFDPTDMVKMKSGETNDEFDDEVTYYVSYNHGLPQAVKIKDNNLKKVISVKKDKVDTYITNNYAAERNENFMVGLIQSVNL